MGVAVVTYRRYAARSRSSGSPLAVVVAVEEEGVGGEEFDRTSRVANFS
jgi:hypothetical protein